MLANKFTPIRILAWVAVALVVAIFATALILTNSVEQVGKSGREVSQIVQHLDSLDSLKTIVVTYSGQYQRAEAHWMEVMNWLLFLLFLVSMLALGLLVALTTQSRRGQAK